jgi:hypothetical protein
MKIEKSYVYICITLTLKVRNKATTEFFNFTASTKFSTFKSIRLPC